MDDTFDSHGEVVYPELNNVHLLSRIRISTVLRI